MLRQTEMDIAKGIGIICVIIGHMGIASLERIIYSFHMPMFFLISGYFLKKYSLREIFLKRCRQLLPPYFLTGIAVILLDVAKSAVRKETLNDMCHKILRWMYAIVYGAGTEHIKPFRVIPIGAVWFLLALLWASCIVCYAMKYQYSAIIILAVAFVGYYSSKTIWLPWSIQAGMTAALYVYIGTQVRKNELLDRFVEESKVHYHTLFIICLAFWLNEMFMEQFGLFLVKNSFPNCLFDVIGSVCGSICVILVAGRVGRFRIFSSICGWFGRHSLIVLCVHLVELNVVPWTGLARRVFGITEHLEVPVLVMKLVWCIAVTMLVLRIKSRLQHIEV